MSSLSCSTYPPPLASPVHLVDLVPFRFPSICLTPAMSFLLDPIGFVADIIAISEALGFQTPAQIKQNEHIRNAIASTQEAVNALESRVRHIATHLRNFLQVTSIVEIRSRLRAVNSIPQDRLELLIRLLLYIKERRPSIVFAIVVKYRIRSRIATLGFAGTSSDLIEQLCERIDRFYRALSAVKGEKTTFVNVRMRSKYKVEDENICAAALTFVATDVCGLSRAVQLAGESACPIKPDGDKTFVLLHSENMDKEPITFDQRRRVFIIGDTRSGKSTLGNSLISDHAFHVSKGITGTTRVEMGEKVEEFGHELWKTEIYDTPGLNDKDGLDLYYQTAIEDEIRKLQRASTLIMTVAADAGLTGSASNSLKVYKELFGEGLASMLLLVLTINEEGDKDYLEEVKEINCPTISKWDSEITEKNVYCVSLCDLRNGKDSPSHAVLRSIASRCRNMNMRIIESLANRYRNLRESLKDKTDTVHRQVQELMNEGWRAYEELARNYECSRQAMMTCAKDGAGNLNGFVIKESSLKLRAVTALSAGVVNRVRKTRILIYLNGRTANEAWQQMVERYKDQSNGSHLMWEFGDIVDKHGLGFMVKEQNMYYTGTLRVTPYSVVVFDPVNHAHEELACHLEKKLQQQDELRPDVLSELMTLSIPTSIRFNREWSYRKRTQAAGTSWDASGDVAMW